VRVLKWVVRSTHNSMLQIIPPLRQGLEAGRGASVHITRLPTRSKDLETNALESTWRGPPYPRVLLHAAAWNFNSSRPFKPPSGRL
jgi:hypothetical protein